MKNNFMKFFISLFTCYAMSSVEDIGTLNSPVLKKFKDINRHEKANTVRFLF